MSHLGQVAAMIREAIDELSQKVSRNHNALAAKHDETAAAVAALDLRIAKLEGRRDTTPTTKTTRGATSDGSN
jgi:hypothetical protein